MFKNKWPTITSFLQQNNPLKMYAPAENVNVVGIRLHWPCYHTPVKH